MNIVDFQARENQFLDEWASREPGFIRDGVVDVNEYFACRFKILMLLKEPNGGADYDLREYFKGEPLYKTATNTVRWTEGLLNIESDIPWESLADIDMERRRKMLRKIAWVNIKKISGGATAIDKEIKAAAVKNSSCLRQQLNLCQPDIVICGGTSPYYIDYLANNENLKWQTAKSDIRFLLDGQRIVIDFYHPQVRNTDKLNDQVLYYKLVDTVREILSIV